MCCCCCSDSIKHFFLGVLLIAILKWQSWGFILNDDIHVCASVKEQRVKFNIPLPQDFIFFASKLTDPFFATLPVVSFCTCLQNFFHVHKERKAKSFNIMQLPTAIKVSYAVDPSSVLLHLLLYLPSPEKKENLNLISSIKNVK